MILRLLALMLILTAAAEAQTKRAFIVGVGEYDELTDLQKTIGDAEGYARVFRAQGFEVTRLVGTPNRRDFVAAFDGFVRSIGSGDEVIFVFSGHGWSDGSENFLALSDTPRAVPEAVLRAETIALERSVMNSLRARNPKITFAIIDACRDEKYDPLTRSTGFSEKGIKRISASEGELILYSAGAGQTSLDRLPGDDPSPYSIFTRILLPKLENSSLPLATIADQTRAEVQALALEHGHQQRPEMMLGVSLSYCMAAQCRTEKGVTGDENGPSPSEEFVSYPYDLNQLPDEMADVAKKAREVRTKATKNAEIARQVELRARMAAEVARQLPPGEVSGGHARFKASNGNYYEGEVYSKSTGQSTTYGSDGFGISYDGDFGYEGNKYLCKFTPGSGCNGFGKIEYGSNDNNTSGLEYYLGPLSKGVRTGAGYLVYKDKEGDGNFAEVWIDLGKMKTGPTPGVIRESDGRLFECEIKGKCNGLGVLWSQNGSLISYGRWKDGKQVAGPDDNWRDP